MGVIRELNGTAEHDNALKRNLTALEGELRDLNNTLQQMRKHLENYLTAGLAGKAVKYEFVCFLILIYVKINFGNTIEVYITL